MLQILSGLKYNYEVKNSEVVLGIRLILLLIQSA